MEFLLNPQNPTELMRFYLIWVTSLFVLHCLFDGFHPRTAQFKLSGLVNKVPEIFAASSVANAYLMGIILWTGVHDHPLFSSDSFQIPLVNAVITSFVLGLSNLSPKANAAASSVGS